ncbi:MAG TPA: hypothetical protein VF710_08385 [Longimicrobium sp.]|jgi:hypothetical protein
MMIRTFSLLALLAMLGTSGASPAFAQAGPLPLSSFVDSTGLHRALLDAPQAPRGTPRRMLFWVRYDSTGTLKDVRALVRRSLPGGYDSAMVSLLRTHLVPRLPSRRAHRETFWLRSGRNPRIAVVDALMVMPSLTDTGALVRAMEAAAKRLLAAHPQLAGHETTRNVSFSIGADGVPSAERVVRDRPDDDIDPEFLGIVRGMRFRPATIEGVPVDVDVELPITMRFRR